MSQLSVGILTSSRTLSQPVRATKRHCTTRHAVRGGPGRRYVTKAVAEPSSAVPFMKDAQHLEEWGPESWRKLTALQQPDYPDEVRRC